jgi:hypothetical protein
VAEAPLGPEQAVAAAARVQALGAAERGQAVEGAGAGGGGGGGGGARAAGTVHPLDQSGLTTCLPGMVWDTKHQKCLVRHSRMLPDPELTK